MAFKYILIRKVIFSFSEKIKLKIKKKESVTNKSNSKIVDEKINLNINQHANTNSLNSKSADIIVKILDNSSSKKYFLINSGFLLVYSTYLIASGYLSDYPNEMKNSMKNLGYFTSLVFFFVMFISKRNIKELSYNRNNKEIIIKTFKFLGFSKRNEFNLCPIKDVRYINPLNNYVPFFNYGFYIIKLRKKQFNFFNYLLFRPLENFNRIEFEKAFNISFKKSL